MTESHVQIVTKNSTFVVNKKKLVDLSVRLHFNVDEVVVDLVKFVHSETGAIVSIDGEERHRLRKQLSAIKVRYQAAAKKGGRQRDSFLAESDKCQVVIRVSDINSVTKLIEENKKLTSEREDARTECAELRAANTLIRQELYNVEQKAIRQNRKVTPKENYSERHKRRVRKTLAETAKHINWTLMIHHKQSQWMLVQLQAFWIRKTSLSESTINLHSLHRICRGNTKYRQKGKG